MTPFEHGLSEHGKLNINDKAFLTYHLTQFFATQPFILQIQKTQSMMEEKAMDAPDTTVEDWKYVSSDPNSCP